MARVLAMAALCAFLLAGCSGTSFTMRVEDLLEAPRLNQRQAEVYQALGAAGVDVGSIVYRYPQRGEHTSPFILYDLDGDDTDEALVFYSLAGEEDAVRVQLLQMDEQGRWHARDSLTNSAVGDQVDFIQFVDLLDGGECLVVSWLDSRRSDTYLGVYSFRDGRFRHELAAPRLYHSFDIDSYLGGELNEIALVELDEYENAFRLSLLGQTPGGLASLGDIPLSPDVNSVLQLKKGRLWDGLNAVYVDERRISDTLIATEVIQVEREGLTMIVGEETDFYNYMTTCREGWDTEYLSVDLAGDGYVDIPTISELPWVIEGGEIKPPPLIEYIRVQPDESFTYSARAVRNEDGYLFFFPEQWLEDGMARVTVLRRPESNEWSFYKVDPDFDSAMVELLSIRIYNTRDYRDQFREEFLLAEKGIREYYGYIPRLADEPLGVSEAQVRECFQLLS